MTERGSASLELALGTALLLVPAALVVLSFGPWLESRSMVEAAAAESARAAIFNNGQLDVRVWEMLESAASVRGVELGSVRLCGADRCPLERGGYVTARVEASVPLIVSPWGEVGGITLDATHTEPVDLYRSMP